MSKTRDIPPAIWMTAIALVILAAGYFLIIRPLDQKRETAQRDTAEKQAAMGTVNQSLTLVGDDRVKVDAIRQAMANFETKLPQADEMDKILENVWRLAQANSLQTRTIKTPAIQNFAGYREQQMDLSLAGDFSGFYQFLLQLEESKRVLRITKMHLTKLSDHEGEVQAEMTLGVFFEPEKRQGDKI